MPIRLYKKNYAKKIIWATCIDLLEVSLSKIVDLLDDDILGKTKIATGFVAISMIVYVSSNY